MLTRIARVGVSLLKRRDVVLSPWEWHRFIASAAASIGAPSTGIDAVPAGFIKLSTILDVFDESRSEEFHTRSNANRTVSAINREEFQKLVESLNSYKLPISDEDRQSTKNIYVREHNVATLAKVKPNLLTLLQNKRIGVAQRMSLLNVMAYKNIRDEELAKSVYSSLAEAMRTMNDYQVCQVAAEVAMLGIHHNGIIDAIKHKVITMIQRKNYDSKEIARVMLSLSKIKMSDMHCWIELAKWTNIHAIMQKNFSKVTRQIDLFLMFSSAALPKNLLHRECASFLEAIKKHMNNVKTKLSTEHLLMCNYAAAVGDILQDETASSLLTQSTVNSIFNANSRESPTWFYQALRLWTVAATMRYIVRDDSKFYKEWCEYFNKRIKENEINENMLWQVKYSRDMSAIHNFRRLLHDVAPLGTHSTQHYIHPERGVLVDADVQIYNGKILSIEQAKELAKKGEQTKTVSVLYFLKTHTMQPRNISVDQLAQLRLAGRNHLAVRLMCSPSHSDDSCLTTHPVVFNEYEMDALKRDDLRRHLIQKRIIGLSTRFHNIELPPKFKIEE